MGKGTEKLLDEAHAAGLTVTLGIWLERVGSGFDYGSKDAIARQTKMVRDAVEKYRGHPALLMWSLGNEGEGHGDDPRYYEHLEDLATMVHELDPDHPTMTVIAELGEGGHKVKDLERLAPSIDAVGINSYGGIRSIPRRYREAGGTRPYLITEFGPKGHWESPRTDWGTPIELSSTEKADLYRSAYRAAVAGQPTCIGAYVFLWGQKQETTATWFGMYLEDGTRLGAVDVMTELWSGEAPENRAPEIGALEISRASVSPGAIIEATLEARDVDSDELQVEWVLRSASPGNGSWGARKAPSRSSRRRSWPANAPGPRSACPSAPGRTASSPTFVTARATVPSTRCRCASRSEVPGGPGGALDVSGKRRRDRRHASHRHHRAAHGRLRRAATQLRSTSRTRSSIAARSRSASASDPARTRTVRSRSCAASSSVTRICSSTSVTTSTATPRTWRCCGASTSPWAAAPSSRPCAITAPSSRPGTITTTAPTSPAGATR